MDKPASLELPFVPPMITVTSNMSELESDIDTMSPAMSKSPGGHLCIPSHGMSYLSPFSVVTRGDRTISESNLSSSGYSSMASPGPSRCGSSNPLCPDMDDPSAGSPGPSAHTHKSLLMRRSGSHGKSCQGSSASGSGKTDSNDQREHARPRSDSETLSDDILLESNDEGIGTDHLDEKIEEGEIKSAKELEIYIGKEMLDTGRSILLEEGPTVAMSQLQLPVIVIQAEGVEKGLSPVSSRSESPISERASSLGRFSPLFYGRKEQHLPFTDSDGLYDFPSSDGKGHSNRICHGKKSSIKRRDRKSTRGGKWRHTLHRNQDDHSETFRSSTVIASPTKSALLEIPAKDLITNHFTKHHTSARKSPKRRPIHRHALASSSSSSESLTPSSKGEIAHVASRKSASHPV